MKWAVIIALLSVAAGPVSQPSMEDPEVRRTEAVQSLADAKIKAITVIHATPRYREAKAHLDECEQVLASARASGTPEQRLAASHDFVAAKKAVQEIDAEVEKDLGVVKARSEVADAELRVKEAKDRLAVARTKANEKARMLSAIDELVKVDYDRFKDVTTYKTKAPVPFELTKGLGRHEFAFIATAAGDGGNAPKRVTLAISSFSRGWIYLKDRLGLELDLIVDGKRLPAHRLSYFDSSVGDYIGGNCHEFLCFDFTTEEVTTILHAKEVDAQVLFTEFSMGKTFQGALAAVAIKSGMIKTGDRETVDNN